MLKRIAGELFGEVLSHDIAGSVEKDIYLYYQESNQRMRLCPKLILSFFEAKLLIAYLKKVMGKKQKK